MLSLGDGERVTVPPNQNAMGLNSYSYTVLILPGYIKKGIREVDACCFTFVAPEPPMAASTTSTRHRLGAVISASQRWQDVKHTVQFGQSATDLLEKNRAHEAARADIAEHLVLEVDSEEALAVVDKRLQGDAELHTVEMWEKRFALRRHKVVREELHKWWMAALPALQSRVDEGQIHPHMDKESYFRIYQLLFRAMAEREGEPYSDEEALASAAEDWASDSRDGHSVSRELFMDAIFQLADL